MKKILSPSVGFSSELNRTTYSDTAETTFACTSPTDDASALASSLKFLSTLPFDIIVAVFSDNVMMLLLCVEATPWISIVTFEAWTKRIVHGLIAPEPNLIYTTIQYLYVDTT